MQRFRDLDVLTRLAWCVWGILIVAVCARVFIASPRSHTVYPIYIAAADQFRSGEDLYGILAPGLDVWRYHPLIAAGFMPWVELPEKIGGVLWRLLNVGVFFFGLRAFHRHVLTQQIPFSALALLSVPLCLHSFNNAQANVLLLGLLMIGVAMFAIERWWLAALALGAATILKCYPISLALLLGLFAPVRFGSRYLFVCTIACIAPYAIHTNEYITRQYQQWFAVMQLDDRLVASIERCTRDVYMVCRVWWVAPSHEVYRVIQMGVALLLAGMCWRLRHQPIRYRFAFDGACLWMTLLGPATEACTYTLLATTFARTLWQRPYRMNVVLAISASLFLYTTCAGAFPKEWRFENAALQPIAGLFLAFAVVVEAIPSMRLASRLDRVAAENPQVSSRALVELG